MKKKCFSCISFILFAVFMTNETFGAVKEKNVKTEREAEIDNQKDNDSAVKAQKTEILLNSNKSAIKEIEVNSVNFIKLKSKANEIFIPDPSILDVQLLSDNSLYLMGLAPGVTSLVINDKDGNVMIDCRIRVTYPLNTIKEAILEMRPDADVELVSLDKTVVLRGRVPSPEIAGDIQDIVGRFVSSDKVVNKLAIETSTQVMLKVKIAEVSRALTKNLGINWRAISAANGASGPSYGFAAGTTAGSFLPIMDDGKALKTALMQNENNILGVTGGSRWTIQSGSKSGLSGLIDALAKESFASILAEPTIIALSGKKAVFKSGGEKGYTVSQPGGTSTNTTEFKEWGTSVEFTPIVLSEDRINITVTPKVSTLEDSGSDKPPSLTSKEATTTVELGSGQSLAIAGLLQRENNTGASEVPGLASLPLIGGLFRSSNISTSERELVIIVTPYIVKPSSKQLKTPIEMVPRMYSPLESMLTRKFHKNSKRNVGRPISAGFSIK